MAGRYTGWRRLTGDTAERPDLLDYGKKLLAHLESQRRLGGASTLSIQRTLDDGSVVLARFVGDQPEIYVQAAEGGEKGLAPKIACNPRNSDFPNGRDPEWTQVGLTPKPGPWGAWFGSKIAGAVVPPPRGIYTQAFPDGIKRGGNCDWRGEGGVVVSFYGPTLRYMYDPYRKPDKQYGRWVFMNGAAVLDIGQYDTDNGLSTPENLVLGAALVGSDLYVMQARIDAFSDDPGAEFAGMTPDGAAAWISPVYPPGDTDLKLFRYSVVPVPTNAARMGRARVAAGSRTLLWSKTASGYVNPWVANPQATVWETFAMPEETRQIDWADAGGWSTPSTGYTINLCSPSESSKHTTLTRTGDAVAEVTVDVMDTLTGYLWEPINGDMDYELSAVFAADYDADGSRVEARLMYRGKTLPSIGDHWGMFLSLGGVEHVLQPLEDPDYRYWFSTQIMALDLRSKSAVLLTIGYPNFWWRVVVNDAVVHTEDTPHPSSHISDSTGVSPTTLFSFNGRAAYYRVNFMPLTSAPLSPDRSRTYSPLQWAYGASAGRSINTKVPGGFTGETYTYAFARHDWIAAYLPLATPSAELVMKTSTGDSGAINWTSGSGSFGFLNRVDADSHAVPFSLLVDEKGNWIASGVAGLKYVVTVGALKDHRMRFPTFWASKTDLPARTGIGPEASGEPTNTYGPMWLFSKY